MPKDTPSMAKNKIRRSLIAVLDPHPKKKEVGALWEYFCSSCAYCAQQIDRKSRTGHLDHVLAVSEGGSNDIHNFVLSCAKCNGDEKREEDWAAFLRKKTDSEGEFQARRLKIDGWISEMPDTIDLKSKMVEAESIIESALDDFDAAVKKIRELRDVRN